MSLIKKEQEKFDNIWSRNNLEWLRGNRIFKGLWRAARIGVIGGLLMMADNSVLILEGFGLSQAWIGLIAPFIEKELREFVPTTAF